MRNLGRIEIASIATARVEEIRTRIEHGQKTLRRIETAATQAGPEIQSSSQEVQNALTEVLALAT